MITPSKKVNTLPMQRPSHIPTDSAQDNNEENPKNTTDSSHQIQLMGASFERRLNQSASKTREMNLWVIHTRK